MLGLRGGMGGPSSPPLVVCCGPWGDPAAVQLARLLDRAVPAASHRVLCALPIAQAAVGRSSVATRAALGVNPLHNNQKLTVVRPDGSSNTVGEMVQGRVVLGILRHLG